MEQPDQDPAYILSRHLYYQVLHALRAALPPPPTDAPGDLTARDHAAIAQVASLLPANGEEALLAAQYVAASAQALDCLRLVRQHPADATLGLKCMAQAASMMRQARSTRSLLLHVQARRQKRDADHAARDNAAWTEHCTIGLMTDALVPARAPLAAEPAPIPAPHANPEPPAGPDQPLATHGHRPTKIHGFDGALAARDPAPPPAMPPHPVAQIGASTHRARDAPMGIKTAAVA